MLKLLTSKTALLQSLFSFCVFSLCMFDDYISACYQAILFRFEQPKHLKKFCLKLFQFSGNSIVSGHNALCNYLFDD